MGNASIKCDFHGIILGLERSGKTSLLQKMVMKEVKDDDVSGTMGFNFEYLESMEKSVGFIEMGGSSIVKEFWSEMYNLVKLDFVFYVINYNEQLFKSNASIHKNEASYNLKKKNIYRSLEEVKYLMNEPALKNCYFFVIINVVNSFKSWRTTAP